MINPPTPMKIQTTALILGITSLVSAFAQSQPIPSPVPVTLAKPSIGTGIEVTTNQPATIDAYFKVDLFPIVAGTIQFLQKDIGDSFIAGETLVEIEPLAAPGTRTPLTAPFDGVIAARSVDPGAVVASALVVPEVNSLLSLQRTDIVTVSAQVPESFATFLDENTLAELTIDALPGRLFQCKPTRYAPNFANNDRTREVQIDLFNGTAAQFDVFIQKLATSPQNNLKGGKQPALPGGLQLGEAAGLMPGMFGSLKLVATRFKDAPLIPSSAILRQGGVPFLMKVENGVARKRQIAIEVDNGTSARVRWADGSQLTDLLPGDEFVAANPAVIEDGTTVVSSKPTP